LADTDVTYTPLAECTILKFLKGVLEVHRKASGGGSYLLNLIRNSRHLFNVFAAASNTTATKIDVQKTTY